MERNMARRKVGRPSELDHDKIREVLLRYKDRIIVDVSTCEILGQGDPLWKTITEEIDYKPWNTKEIIKNAYSYVCDNTKNIRHLLCPNFFKKRKAESLDESVHDNSTLDSSYDYGLELTFRVKYEIFESSFVQVNEIKEVSRSKRQKKIRKEYEIKVDVFGQFMETTLTEKSRRSCLYVYKCQGLNQNKSTGRVTGKCSTCGSKINCFFEKDKKVMVIKCEINDGKETEACGKRSTDPFLSTTKKSTAKKRKLDEERNSPDCQLQTETITEPENSMPEYHLHSNPIRSIEILKTTTLKYDILCVRRYPIGVIYITPHQKTIYKTLVKDKHMTIAITVDDTIIQRVQRPNNILSDSITYYQAVAISSKGNASVSQCLLEGRRNCIIANWLIQWIEGQELLAPNRIVIQGGNELASGCIKAFSHFKSLSEYVGTFDRDKSPAFLLQIDPASILERYVIIMNDEERDVVQFYLQNLIKLIQCRELLQIEEIARALLTIAYSETTSHKEAASADYALSTLKKFPHDEIQIDEESLFKISDETKRLNERLTINLGGEPTYWTQWAEDLLGEAKSDIAECPGDVASRYYMPHLGDRLRKDLEMIPLWNWSFQSNDNDSPHTIMQKAREESTKVKQYLKAKYSLPIRADDFVEAHKKFVDGDTDSQTTDSQPPSEDRSSPEDFRESFNGTQICSSCNNEIESTKTICLVCDAVVHSYSPCSIPMPAESEKYGVDRVCRSCSRKPNVHKMMESNHFENWRNQVVIYETQEKQKNNRTKLLPILAKGNKVKLATYVLDGKPITIHLACAFDSLTQLMLLEAFESPTFYRDVIKETKNRNLFMQFIDDTLTYGVTELTFYQRFRLLDGLFGKDKETLDGVTRMNCSADIGETCEDVLCNIPSIVATIKCINGCLNEIDPSVSLQVTLETFINGDSAWTKALEELFPAISIKCQKSKTCKAICSYELKYGFILLETFPNYRKDDIELRQIPTVLNLPIFKESLHLRGFINFKPPIEIREGKYKNRKIIKDVDKTLGHFSTFHLHEGSWTEYDSLSIPHDETFKVLPRLVLFTL